MKTFIITAFATMALFGAGMATNTTKAEATATPNIVAGETLGCAELCLVQCALEGKISKAEDCTDEPLPNQHPDPTSTAKLLFTAVMGWPFAYKLGYNGVTWQNDHMMRL
ncbi:hypothetical protein NA57DRAFT_60475 [Rhizodiscina lignyota]|uniref:Uncharacterized protein n=1 Tax=Rhizodiscina lignyota TaxID=1504668 RepID=A0A9P4I3J8_9PEZI|nr:hypothetical protein NA57DRAFT_60475 [Rhizodiscina lignyota]